MPDTPVGPRARPAEAGDPAEPVRYPTNHVLAVFDTEEQLAAAVEALTSGGFLATEIDVHCGPMAADRLDKSSGRRGLAGLAIRIAERLGVADEEMESKEEYEQALREGRFLLRVATGTEDRKDAASRILHEHGARLTRFFGRFSIERLTPPGTA